MHEKDSGDDNVERVSKRLITGTEMNFIKKKDNEQKIVFTFPLESHFIVLSVLKTFENLKKVVSCTKTLYNFKNIQDISLILYQKKRI